jgi:hypothetical protein
MTDMDRKIVEKVCEDRAKGSKSTSIRSIWAACTGAIGNLRNGQGHQGRLVLADGVLDAPRMSSPPSDDEPGCGERSDSPVKRIMSVVFTQSRGRSMIGRGRRAIVPKDKKRRTTSRASGMP